METPEWGGHTFIRTFRSRERDAWEQWNSAKLADVAAKKQGINRENAYAAAVAIIQGAKSGQIKNKVNREQIREILSTIGKQTRREWKITRK